jgi:hypothetical protein
VATQHLDTRAPLSLDLDDVDERRRDLVSWLTLGFAGAVLGTVATLVGLTIANRP